MWEGAVEMWSLVLQGLNFFRGMGGGEGKVHTVLAIYSRLVEIRFKMKLLIIMPTLNIRT